MLTRVVATILTVAAVACGEDIYTSDRGGGSPTGAEPDLLEPGDECVVDCDCADGNVCADHSCEYGYCVVRMLDGDSCVNWTGTCRGGWCCSGGACFEPYMAEAASCAAIIDDHMRE